MGDSASTGVLLFGVRLAGFSTTTGHKLMLSLAFTLALFAASYALRWLLRLALRDAGQGRPAFWARQGLKLLTGVLFAVGLVSIWFDDPARLGTAAGLVTAGIAVALQRVITSFAAYCIVLRGRVFTVGDRITIGGIRGDVVALGFMQTTVMEMGEPAGARESQPRGWVAARQYTGRLVRVTNDKIFERILLDAASTHTRANLQDPAKALENLRTSYLLPEATQLEPQTYYRLTDNWLELTVRFVVPQRGVRIIKDAISRDVLRALEQAGIGIVSATCEIVGLPSLHVDGAHRSGLAREQRGD
jgi:hypothetical protein